MKEVCDFDVVKIAHLEDDDFELVVKHRKKLLPIVPGQFVNILVPDTQHTFLRRPISVCDVDFQTNEVKFYIRKVGNGTLKLSEVKVGDALNIVYPLGTGFSLTATKPLLIGGGCGIAPLVYLAKEFSRKGILPKVLLGGKTFKSLALAICFEGIADVVFSTDDGSLGHKGLLTTHRVMADLTKFDCIYTCGPEVMMKAVAKLAHKAKVPCEVSLENTMACGIGACLCCVTETTQGHQCVCTEGPVFNTNRLKDFI